MRAHARLQGGEDRAARRGKIAPVISAVVSRGERVKYRARAEVRVQSSRSDEPARARGKLLREGVLAVDARGVVREGEEAEDRVAAARRREGEGRRARERVSEDGGRARPERAALGDGRDGEALLLQSVQDLALGRDEEEDAPRHE